MGAVVNTRRYEGRAHTVLPREIESAREILFRSL
jgi:hypothetical protein